MKTMVLGLAALFLSTTTAFGQFGEQTYFFTETYATATGDAAGKVALQPTMDAWWQENLSGRVGTFMWAQIVPQEGKYRQIYGGPSYQVADWLQVGVGGGVERAENKGRLGSFAYLTPIKNNSVFMIYEDGGSGPWWLLLHTYRFGLFKQYGIGVMSQAYLGTGPRVEYNWGKLGRWKAWSSLHFQRNARPGFQIGIRWVYAAE